MQAFVREGLQANLPLASSRKQEKSFCFRRGKTLDLQGFPLAISNRSLREDQGPPLPICALPFYYIKHTDKAKFENINCIIRHRY